MNHRHLSVLLIGALMAPLCQAQSWTGGTRLLENFAFAGAAESRYTSNLGAQADGDSAQVFSPRVAARYLSDGPAWQADIRAIGQWFSYNDPLFKDESFLTADATLNAWLPANRVRWDLRHRSGPISADPLAPQNPRNVESLSSTIVGPRLFLNPGVGTQLTLGLQAGQFSVSGAGSATERRIGDMEVTRRVGPGIDAAGRVEWLDSSNSDAPQSDFERMSAQLLLRRSGGRSQFEAGVSLAASSVANGTETSEGGGWISLLRQLRGGHQIQLSILKETADTGSRLSTQRNSETLAGFLEGLTAVSDISTVQDADVLWTWNRGQTRLQLGLGYRSEDFFLSPFDRRESNASLGWSWAMSQRHTLSLQSTRAEREFIESGRQDTVSQYFAALSMQPRRGLQYVISASSFEQSSDTAAFNFDETAVRFLVIYGDSRAAELLR